jgi:hypothetical protein
MKKGLIGATLVFLIAVGLFGAAYANTYALYYTCTGTQDTHLVIMNSGGLDTYYTLKVLRRVRNTPRCDVWGPNAV